MAVPKLAVLPAAAAKSHRVIRRHDAGSERGAHSNRRRPDCWRETNEWNDQAAKPCESTGNPIHKPTHGFAGNSPARAAIASCRRQHTGALDAESRQRGHDFGSSGGYDPARGLLIPLSDAACAPATLKGTEGKRVRAFVSAADRCPGGLHGYPPGPVMADGVDRSPRNRIVPALRASKSTIPAKVVNDRRPWGSNLQRALSLRLKR